MAATAGALAGLDRRIRDLGGGVDLGGDDRCRAQRRVALYERIALRDPAGARRSPSDADPGNVGRGDRRWIRVARPVDL